MSVRTMARVWAESQHSGSELLMLLAIADFADDGGNAYPSVATLAKKCRMQLRNANYVLAALQRSGELEVRANEGPRGTNRYCIKLAQEPERVQRLAVRGAAKACTPAGACTLQRVAPTPATDCAKPLQAIADEPSLNHQEPSDKATSSPAGLPACPHRELIAMFAEKVPDLPMPRVELWTKGAAAKDLAARWKWVLSAKRAGGDRYATSRNEAIAWFGRFFDSVAASDFLTGRSGKWRGCSLQWLVKPSNFAKVVENHYSNEAATA